MTARVIRWDAEKRMWFVRGRVITHWFETLHEAECWVLAQ